MANAPIELAVADVAEIGIAEVGFDRMSSARFRNGSRASEGVETAGSSERFQFLVETGS